ncbi:MAG TPA: flagellar filament capping protein FliD [Rhizobacter sp.]|jgi:flagellar hook-associated protein 2|nr:flagellar filament capping protein FliD [Rhizobacter sp.]
MSTFDPVTTAQQLAQMYVSGRRTSLDTQTKTNQAQLSALDKLQTALRSFDTALSALSAKKGVSSKSTSLSVTGVATASATSSAIAGNYKLFVEQMATAQQTSYEFPVPVPASGAGALAINLADGSSFTVDLQAADADGDGNLSPTEVARAINMAAGNGGKATGMVMTVGGISQLVISSGGTGLSNGFSLDLGNVGYAPLKAALQDPTKVKQIATAQDAVVWVGEKGSGVRVQQASNTFTGIDGLSVQLQRAQAAGDAALNLTVADDQAATTANVQGFIDAYNTLTKVIDDLSAGGDATKGKAAGALAMDSGVRSLRRQLNGILRTSFGGASLVEFGVSATRDGTLALDSARLQKRLAASSPDALQTLFGATGITTSSGLLGAFDKYLDTWTASSTGFISRRKDGLQKTQTHLASEQTRVDAMYDSAYERYLKQYSALQSLQSQMSQTGGLLSSLSPAAA